MKPLKILFGLAAACAACCALPLLVPMLAGLSLSGVGWVMSDCTLLVVGLLAIVAGSVWRHRARYRGPHGEATTRRGCDCASTACGIGAKLD